MSNTLESNQKGINIINETAQGYLEQCNIKISNKDHVAVIAHGFIKAVIEYLDERKQEGSEVELNILQLFDMGIAHEETEDGDGEFIPYINPGQETKLLCKNDEESEE